MSHDHDRKPDSVAAQSETPKPRKKAWAAPRIVSTRAAFEHAILTCNGLVPPNFEDFGSRSPKGSCTSGGTASS